MANGRSRSLGVGIAGIAVLVVGLAVLNWRPGPNGPPNASTGRSNASTQPTATSAAPTPTSWNGDFTTDPIRPRADGMGGLDVELRSEIRAGTTDRSTLAMTATYDAVVDLGVRSGTLHVTATIIARNDDSQSIDRIELNTVAPVLGAMVLERVTVDGNEVNATVDGQTIVVPLGGVLPPGGRVRLQVAYGATVDARSSGYQWLFTRADGIVALYRWLPWVSRVVPWERRAGDPFVTPTSPNVRVRLRTDRPVIVGASGPQVAGPAQPSRDMTFAGSDVRDFNLILSDGYGVSTENVEGITVRVLTHGGLNVAGVHALARRALSTYGRNLGPYPYPELTIAESVASVGMESPAIVWIPRGSTASRLNDVVPHEIAHEWFYALVGNDQVTDPFADEAIASFMSRDLMNILRGPRCPPAPADGSIYDYSDPCYYETVYIRGALLYDGIRDDIGDAAFWAAVKGYVDAHRFGFGSTRELLDALDAATPLDLRPRIEALLPSLY